MLKLIVMHISIEETNNNEKQEEFNRQYSFSYCQMRMRRFTERENSYVLRFVFRIEKKQSLQ